jgi:hypothetical protein
MQRFYTLLARVAGALLGSADSTSPAAQADFRPGFVPAKALPGLHYLAFACLMLPKAIDLLKSP